MRKPFHPSREPFTLRTLYSGIVLSLALVLAVATISTGPTSSQEAFSWSKTQAPTTAANIQFEGDSGIDRMVQIGFYLNSISEVQQYTQGFQCPMMPITDKDNTPFFHAHSGAPAWWRSGPAPANSFRCETSTSSFYREARIEPDGDRFWVQLWANSL